MPVKEVRIVCKECFMSTNDKLGVPRLVTRDQTTQRTSQGKEALTCKLCSKPWVELRVVLGPWNRWKVVHERPDDVRYHVCARAGDCCDSACKKAHSIDELEIWKQDRDMECGVDENRPRPFPEVLLSQHVPLSEVKAQMCDAYCDLGKCADGQHCILAHTLTEMRNWKGELERRRTEASVPPVPQPLMSKQFGNSMLGRRQSRIRQRPQLPYIRYFRMCFSVANRTKCVNGDQCTYAHSFEEQQHWNDRISHPPTATGGPRGRVAAAGGGSRHEFVEEVRTLLTKTSPGEVMRPRSGVNIYEETNTPLRQQVSVLKKFHWTFTVKSTAKNTLKSIVLANGTVKHIALSSAAQFNVGKLAQTYPAVPGGQGILINAKVSPQSLIKVKIVYNPTKAAVSQVVVFQFNRFLVGHLLAVDYVEADDIGAEIGVLPKHMKMSNVNRANAALVDSGSLFWEEQFELIPCPKQSMSNEALEQYPIPIEVEKQLKDGFYDNLEAELNPKNYRSCLRILLYLEEMERRHRFKRFDIFGADLEFSETALCGDRTIGGGSDCDLCVVPMDAAIDDHELSLSTWCTALLRPKTDFAATVYEAEIAHVGRNFVVLKVLKVVTKACRGWKVDIRFSIYRDDFRLWHHALDKINLDLVFPNASTNESALVTRAPPILDARGLEAEVKHNVLNESQLAVLDSILHLKNRHVPTILAGPFGTGKTRALVEAVLLLLRFLPTSKVLVCTYVNVTADNYIRDLHQKWTENFGGKRLSMFRYVTRGRQLSSVHRDVHPYCRISQGRNQFECPSATEIMSYQCIVTSMAGAGELMFQGLPKDFFTHIIIDEAAQMIEPATIVPLTMASPGCKIVLAGDIQQIEPVIMSSHARRYNLHKPLLDRLYYADAYIELPLLRIDLLLNYRCVREILDLASDLFYGGKVQHRHTRKPGGPQDRAALSFRHIDGKEKLSDGSPSFYNTQEGEAAANEVRKFVEAGLKPSEIAVVAPYAKQVEFVRYLLRKKNLGSVTVLPMRALQGHEFRALVVTTVRTCGTERERNPEDPTLGFLSGPKLFNTLITRAEEWLVVVGDSFTLVTIGNNRGSWNQYITRCHRMQSFFAESGDAVDPKALWNSAEMRDFVANANDPALEASQAPRASQLEANKAAIETFKAVNADVRDKIMRPRLESSLRELYPHHYHLISVALCKMSVEEVFDMLSNVPYLKQRAAEVAQRHGYTTIASDELSTADLPSHLIVEPAMPGAPRYAGMASSMSDMQQKQQPLAGPDPGPIGSYRPLSANVAEFRPRQQQSAAGSSGFTDVAEMPSYTGHTAGEAPSMQGPSDESYISIWRDLQSYIGQEKEALDQLVQALENLKLRAEHGVRSWQMPPSAASKLQEHLAYQLRLRKERMESVNRAFEAYGTCTSELNHLVSSAAPSSDQSPPTLRSELASDFAAAPGPRDHAPAGTTVAQAAPAPASTAYSRDTAVSKPYTPPGVPKAHGQSAMRTQYQAPLPQQYNPPHMAPPHSRGQQQTPVLGSHHSTYSGDQAPLQSGRRTSSGPFSHLAPGAPAPAYAQQPRLNSARHPVPYHAAAANSMRGAPFSQVERPFGPFVPPQAQHAPVPFMPGTFGFGGSTQPGRLR